MRVNEVLTRDAKGNPLTQEVRIYNTGTTAEADDGSTGLVKKLPTIIGEFDELTVDGRPMQALTRLRMSDFLLQSVAGSISNDISSLVTGVPTGALNVVSESTDFSAGKPAFLTELAPVGTISYSSGNAVLDANGNEADYTNDNTLMLYHAIPGAPLAGARLRTNFANPNDGTADASLTFVGVFFEDEVNDYICSWGAGASGSSQYTEGQRRQKGVETYNFWGYDQTVTTLAGLYASIAYLGLDGNGDAQFEGFSSESVSEGTVIVPGMRAPTRCGLMFMSFAANSDPADRIAYSNLSIDYSYFS